MSSENLILLAKNNEWALGDLLAIETHLQEFQSEGNINIPNSWCLLKHKTHLLVHAISEGIIHSSGEQSEKYSQFKKEATEVLNDPNLTADKVRRLRNKFRETMNDKTLQGTKETCGICALDRAKSHAMSDETTMYKESETNIWPWIIGGIVIVGVIYLLAKK